MLASNVIIEEEENQENYHQPTHHSLTNAANQHQSNLLSNTIQIQRLSNTRCLFTNFPNNSLTLKPNFNILSQDVIQSHTLLVSFHHRGYIVPNCMINSLKRILQQDYGLIVQELPPLASHMFQKHINQATSVRYLMKESQKDKLRHQFHTNDDDSCSEIKVGKYSLTKYQIEDIQYFDQNEGRIIIGDEWGMGKTITALSIIQRKHLTSIILLCPPILKLHWQTHFKQLSQFQCVNLTIMHESEDILSYLSFLLKQQMSPLLNKNALLIIDEPHCYSMKTVSLLVKLSQYIKYVIILASNKLKDYRKTEQILEFLPILNHQLSFDALKARYSASPFNEQSNQYFYQFQAAIYSHYLTAHSRRQYQLPAVIKHFYLSNSNQDSSKLNQNNKELENKELTKQIEKKSNQNPTFCNVAEYISTILLPKYQHESQKNEKILVISKQIERLQLSLLQSFGEVETQKHLVFSNMTAHSLEKIANLQNICLALIVDSTNEIQNENNRIQIKRTVKRLLQVTQKIQYCQLVNKYELNQKGSGNWFLDINDENYMIESLDSLEDQIVEIDGKSYQKCQNNKKKQKIKNKKKCRIVYFDSENPDEKMIKIEQSESSTTNSNNFNEELVCKFEEEYLRNISVNKPNQLNQVSFHIVLVPFISSMI